MGETSTILIVIYLAIWVVGLNGLLNIPKQLGVASRRQVSESL